MEVLWISLIIVGVAVFLLCFNLIFRKGKPFPDGEIGHNKELRKRGIICAKEEELRLWGKKKEASPCSSCGYAECIAKEIKEKKSK